MTSTSKEAGTAAVSTRHRLLRAAERLFAEDGIGPTSTRAILREAEQRNESALQYHFGGREGLVQALYAERGAEVNEERQLMFEELEEKSTHSLRDLCSVALMPPVRIARRDPEFARFLKIVGELVFMPNAKLRAGRVKNDLETVERVSKLLRSKLELPKALVARRLEMMDRMAALFLAQRARAGESFAGAEADLFFETTLDAMVALLCGPISDETERSLAASSRHKRKSRSSSKKKAAAKGKSTKARRGKLAR